MDDQGPLSQPGETPSNAIRQGIALSGWSNEAGDEAEPVVHDEVPLWAIEGQQGLTPKQMGKARWVCVNLSSPGPHGLVPRSASSEVLDMTGHSDLIRVLSSVWELPYAGVRAMDGLAVWHSKEQCTTMKVPHGADQILLIPLTGEVSVMTLGSTGKPEEVRLSEQATLLSRSADTAELRLKGESAVLVMYRLKQPKTVENLQKAKRAGLYPHIPTATQQEKKGIPKATNRTDGSRGHRALAY